MSDRIPPHDEGAEQSVLGSMMLSAEAIADVVEEVRSEDFYRSAHRTIFDAIAVTYASAAPVDVVTVKDELAQRGDLEKVGGALYLQHLIEIVSTPASAGYHARIVVEHARRRRLIQAAGQIIQGGYEAKSVDELSDAAEQMVYAATHRNQSTGAVTITDAADHALTELEEFSGVGMPTGWHDLDEIIGGLRPGMLVLIAARPSVGKTSFVVNLARAVAVDHAKSVMLFSLEMSEEEVTMRLLCSEARVSWQTIRRALREDGAVPDTVWAKLVAAVEVFHERPLYIVDAPVMTVLELRSRVRRMKQVRGVDLVVVDYVQLMSAHTQDENRNAELAQISRGLKVLAKELEVPVVVVSQLNRKIEQRKGNRPQLSDLRDSGALEADADVVAFIHRDSTPGNESKKAEVIVAKQRNGPVGTVRLTFLPELMRFVNWAPERKEDRQERL